MCLSPNQSPSNTFQLGEIEKAFEEDLNRRRGVKDFEEMGLMDEEEVNPSRSKSKDRAGSTDRPGSAAGSSVASGSVPPSAPGSPTKRRPDNSPPGKGGKSPKKKARSTTPKASGSKQK